jgi:ubiquitin-conjugating enzyme E2 J2
VRACVRVHRRARVSRAPPAMAVQTSTHRLRVELRNMAREPPQHITARPLPSNILQWYFLLEGPPGTPFEGGLYLGRLAFPTQYPYKPPAVYMCTPQGRFKTEQKLCLSMSDFHPETWSPMWSVSAVLTGLLAFMLLDEETVGSIHTSTADKRALAKASHAFNRSHKLAQELFPEFVQDATPPPPLAAQAAAAGKPQRTANSRKRGAAGPEQNLARPAVVADSTDHRRGRQDQDKESLPSLLAWLVVFVGIVLAIFKLITSP